MGHGCSTEVAPRNLEVMGSNPAECWAFFFFFFRFLLSLPTFFHHWSVLYQGLGQNRSPLGGAVGNGNLVCPSPLIRSLKEVQL